MKRIFLMLIFLIGLAFTGMRLKDSNRGYKITYHLIYQPGNGAEPEEIQNVEFALRFNDRQAVFKLIGKYSQQETRNRFAILFAGGKKTYYTSLSENALITRNEHFGQTYLVKDPLNYIHWTLTSVSKIIDGYKCYRAIGFYVTDVMKKDKNGKLKSKPKKAIVYAWYTPELPVPFGPAKYVGLPGVILDVYDLGNHHMRYRAVEVEQLENVNINFPKGEKLSRETYQKKVMHLLGVVKEAADSKKNKKDCKTCPKKK